MPAPSKCPPFIYEIMQSCWSKQPEDRPDFKRLKSELHECINRVTQLCISCVYIVYIHFFVCFLFAEKCTVCYVFFDLVKLYIICLISYGFKTAAHLKHPSVLIVHNVLFVIRFYISVLIAIQTSWISCKDIVKMFQFNLRSTIIIKNCKISDLVFCTETVNDDTYTF